MNCVTKGTKIESGRGSTPHLNDIQYTIRDVALRVIVGSSGICAGMVVTKVWDGMDVGAGVAVISLGVTSTGVRDKGMRGHLLRRDSGVL